MGRRCLSAFVTLALVLLSLPLGAIDARAAGTHLVISQVYGGGGNAGATLKNDFIELYNPTAASLDVTGWSVQYASSAGTTWQVTAIAGVIAPGRYYLVQESAGAGGTVDLPAPNAVGTIAMAAGAAKVALRDSTAAFTGTCPAAPIDFVGYGTANCSETAPTAALSNTTAAIRKLLGEQDTDNNAGDFDVAAPNPRSTADHAPAVVSTSPANNQGAISPSANITVTFSEPVNVTGSWYAISCSLTGTHAAAVTGGPTTLTLDPTEDFDAAGETCIVRVIAANVSDQDTEDPPDLMRQDFQWSFAVVIAAVSFRIHDVQGAAHLSSFLGTSVSGVPGIVTQLRAGGFYLQDPSPDADARTSEGISVTSGAAVAVGDSVTVSGLVSEVRTGSGNLSTTTLAGSPTVVVVSHGNPLPAALRIDIDRSVPKSVIEDDAPADVETGGVFDPASDGIDFWESLEGMRVDLGTAAVVGPSNRFGEISVVANGGTNSPSARGGVIISATDKNPERVIIKGVGFTMPGDLSVGDRLTGPAGAAVIGVVDYDFGNFMIQVSTSPTVVRGGLAREVTALPGAHELTVATFNVQNLDPGDATFGTMASLIVNNLRSPDVISIEEIQDNNGETNDGTVDATVTLTTLRDAIVAAGGPTYSWREIDPVDQQDGGAPGGNIRQVFFFRTDTGVAFVDRPGAGSTTANSVVTVGGRPQLLYSPGRIDPANSAFNSSRKPLAGEFTYNGHRLVIVANHFNSKGGDDALWGHRQPPVLSSEVQRRAQATIVRDFVRQVLAVDANAMVVVLGDLNDFEFSNPIVILKGTPLDDLIETLAPGERYTYVFEGNSQSLDHILVSDRLLALGARTDIVHVNSEFWDAASDHEPQVATLPLLDRTPPTITAPADVHAFTGPLATSCATVVSDVALGTATATDDAPGIPTVIRSGVPSGNAFPVGSTTVTHTASDSAGNSASAMQTVTVTDDTVPVIATPANASYQLLSLVPAANTADATATDNCGATVTVSQASNGGAGSPASPLVLTRTYTATDAAGNSAAATQTITVIDTTLPTITGAPTTSPNANHWWNTPVTVHFTCTDNSGLVTCPADVTLSGDGADQGVTGTATDAAGNSASVTVGDIDIDRTAPTITFAGATSYTVDQIVAITCAAADALSGIDAAHTSCPGAAGPAYTFGLGAHTLGANATDLASNVATAQLTYTVKVDAPSLCALAKKLVTKADVGWDLCEKLLGDSEDRDQGDRDREDGRVNNGRDEERGRQEDSERDGKKATKRINSFIKEVEKQRGRALTNANADLLIALARTLLP